MEDWPSTSERDIFRTTSAYTIVKKAIELKCVPTIYQVLWGSKPNV